MFGAVPVESVDGHYDGELLAGFCTEGRRTEMGIEVCIPRVPSSGAEFGVVVLDELFGKGAFVESFMISHYYLPI